MKNETKTNVEEVEETKEEKELSLDELLKNPKYQSEFDKKVAKSIETATSNAKAKWEQEQADKIAESQKLANMDELQKKDYEIERLNKELSKRDEEKQANDLMTEAIKQANEKGIPLEIMTALNYKNETAESIASKIAIYDKAFQTQKTNVIAEYSKEKAPQTGNANQTIPTKDWGYEDYAKHYEDE